MDFIQGFDRNQLQMMSFDEFVKVDSWALVVDLFVECLPIETFGISSIEQSIKIVLAGLVPSLILPELQVVDVCNCENHINCNSFFIFNGNKYGLFAKDGVHNLFDRIPISQKEFGE